MTRDRKTDVCWTRFNQDRLQLVIAATEKGLLYVGSPNKPLEELEDWLNRRSGDSRLFQDDDICRPYAQQLSEYLQGMRTVFTCPTDMRGTPFQLEVWAALQRIPYGQTRSYSEIAGEIARPEAARAVGAAIGANPMLIAVPCHRVIAKNGALAGYRGGLDLKSRLLKLENAKTAKRMDAR